MAVMDSAMKRENLRRWAISSKEKAQLLLAQTEELSRTVFSSLENYISFLNLTARIHHYDAYNLLLIWRAYPSASYLAGYKTWERMLPAGAQVLKNEHKGKSIDLIAPFTESSDSGNRLVWYSVSVFDVTQTMLQTAPPSFDPAYILDDEHIYFLMDAMKTVFGTRYDRSVVVQPANQVMQELGLPGEITSRTITARDDLPPDELLQWFTQALSHLAIADRKLTPPASQLLRDSIQYCLLRIWGLEKYARAPGSSIQLKAVDPGHLPFLHILRDTVRELNNCVCSCYTAKRRDDDDLEDDSLEDLFTIS